MFCDSTRSYKALLRSVGQDDQTDAGVESACLKRPSYAKRSNSNVSRGEHSRVLFAASCCAVSSPLQAGLDVQNSVAILMSTVADYASPSLPPPIAPSAAVTPLGTSTALLPHYYSFRPDWNRNSDLQRRQLPLTGCLSQAHHGSPASR